MNPLRDAIRAKRSSGGLVDHGSQPQQPQDQGGDMHALAASLSDGDKSKLMSLLSGSGGKSASASDIEKGKPSDTERAAIDRKMMEGNTGDPMDGPDDDGSIGDDERDDIAMSMLDTKHKNGDFQAAKPLNLGDRAKMKMAQNLKGKGKI